MSKKNPWWSKWGKDKLCGITHSRIRPGKNVHGMTYVITLKCNHYFYRSALIEWTRKCDNNNLTCPICRYKFDINDCFN